MPRESNAERQRRKLDFQRDMANKEKDLKRYHSKKKLVESLSERTKRAQRKKWRETKKQQRAKTKILRTDIATPVSDTSISQVSTTSKELTAKRKKQKQTSHAREIIQLKRENESLKRANGAKESYRKRAFRLSNKVNMTPNKIGITPKSSAQIMFKECFKGKQSAKATKLARKLFIKHASLVSALREKYSSSNMKTNMKNNEEEKIIKRVIEKNVKAGTYMLVRFEADDIRKTSYRYVVVAQNDIEEDGEVTVMSFASINQTRRIFKTVEDISYIKFEQILKILPEPKLKLIGGHLRYEFPFAIDVFQKS